MLKSAVRELRQARPIASDQVPPLGPLVLFACDDPEVTSVGTRMLQGAGYRVRTARVEPLTTKHLLGNARGFALGEEVELVMLDASKHAERALAVLEALRGRDAALPVILVADSDPAVRDEAARLGADGLMDVPLDLTRLKGLVEVLTPLVPDLATALKSGSGRPH